MSQLKTFNLDDECLEVLEKVKGRKQSQYIRSLIKAKVNILPTPQQVVQALNNKQIELYELMEATRIYRDICEARIED